MNSDELALFALVARAGSFSAAAVASGQDVSTLSRRIAQLEKSAGTRLFIRSGRGVLPTDAGQLLLGHADQVAAQLEAALADLSRSGGQGPARIRVAAQPTIARIIFGDLFHAIRTRFPNTAIHFTEALAERILADLNSGEIDLAVLYRPENAGSIEGEPLLLEKLYLLTPRDTSITEAQLRTRWLAEVPLVLPSTRHGLRVLVESMAARRGIEPLIALESDSSNAMTIELVRKGCGCTVLPIAAASADIAAGALRAFALEGPDAERCISMVLGRTRIEPTDLWALADLVREQARALVMAGAWPGAHLPD